MRGLKLGVIGLGSMGKHHARIAHSLSGIKLSCVCDLDPSLAEAAGRQFNLPFFDDFHKLLPLVDAVIIATPARSHFEVAHACLDAGKHVLLEKPFTGVSGSAQGLVSLASTKGLVLASGFIERFNPALQVMLKQLKGEKIIGVDIKRLSPFPERITDTDVVFDMMLHDLDLLRLIVPLEIDSVRAKGEKIRTEQYDRMIANIAYKNGIVARIEASRVFSVRTRNISVTTEKYLLEADLLEKRFYARDFSSSSPSTLPVKKNDQLTEEIRAFILSVKGKRPPSPTGADAVNALQLAEEVTRNAN